MAVYVLEDTLTGESVCLPENEPWEDAEYIWVDGNYACDCNRRLFFWRAQDIEPGDDDDEHDCGSERYGLSVIESGRTVYRD